MIKKREWLIKKLKNPIIIVGIIAIVFIIIGIGSSLSSTSSAKAAYLNNQVVEGLSFENANLVYQNGISTYTVEVYNDSNQHKDLKTITIEMKDDTGTVIATLTGYIGDKIEKDEAKYLQASIDQELKNIATIDYKISK